MDNFIIYLDCDGGMMISKFIYIYCFSFNKMIRVNFFYKIFYIMVLREYNFAIL